MKKKITLLLGLIIVMMLSGCGMAVDMKGDIKKNGSGKFTVTFGYSKDILDAIQGLSDGMSEEENTESVYDKFEKKKIDGKTYYCMGDSFKFKNATQLEKILTDCQAFNKNIDIEDEKMTDNLFSAVFASGDSFVGYPNKKSFESMSDTSEYQEVSGDEAEMLENIDVYMGFSLTFDKKILSTNGKLSKDKKTVTWSIEQLQAGKKLYAYTTTKKPSIKVNVANNKSYKKAVKIKCKSGKGAMYLDGKVISSGTVVKTVGKHTLVTIGKDGKKKTIKFTIKK